MRFRRRRGKAPILPTAEALAWEMGYRAHLHAEAFEAEEELSGAEARAYGEGAQVALAGEPKVNPYLS